MQRGIYTLPESDLLSTADKEEQLEIGDDFDEK